MINILINQMPSPGAVGEEVMDDQKKYYTNEWGIKVPHQTNLLFFIIIAFHIFFRFFILQKF